MARSLKTLVVILFVGLIEVIGQGRPDFGGKWTLIRSDGTQEVGAYGETFTATQYPTTLIVDWSFVRPQVQGAPPQPVEQIHARV
jgi:hypothetical protein